MSIFNSLFISKNNTRNKIPENANLKIEVENNNVKCLNCNTLIDKNEKYCFKCQNQLNEKLKEKKEFQYPEIELINDENIRTAIKNIPNNGILNVPIGLDKDNKWIYYDITKMPNLLIGGTVMSGKTNMINLLLISLISKYSSQKLKIILADSKGVDYSYFNEDPHILKSVIKEASELESTLKFEITEMKNRYSTLNSVKLKRISDYNELEDVTKMAYHLIFIDDYSVFTNKLNNTCNQYIETLAKNGWNVGVHLIIVANHPTVDVLSAMSQLNFPTRISFRVPTIKDSRMVLGLPGAEKLSGIGKALINSPLYSTLVQIHMNVIDDNDILAIINDLSTKNEVEYTNIYPEFDSRDTSVPHDDYEEPLYEEIVEYVTSCEKMSASLLQRKFKFGYNRAARVIDLLEENGIIGPMTGSSSSREVIVKAKD